MRSLISASGSQRLALTWVDSQVINPRPGLPKQPQFYFEQVVVPLAPHGGRWYLPIITPAALLNCCGAEQRTAQREQAFVLAGAIRSSL